MYASLREETTCTAVVMGGGGGRGEGVGGGGEGGGRGRRGSTVKMQKGVAVSHAQSAVVDTKVLFEYFPNKIV